MVEHLPKIELHCHLDASVRVQTVAEIGRDLGLPLPDPLESALVAPEVCADLADYLRRIDLAVDVMQRPADLTRIARELVEDLAADGVIYGEVRFAPQRHLARGMSLQEVLDAVHAGLVAGRERHGVETGLILCCLRNEPPSRSEQLARLAIANRDKVCALDLAGDEARYAGAPHARAFALARTEGLHVTIHAGEGAGPESVREALEVLHAERIGHGARIAESAGLVEDAGTRAIPLEMCPKSNVQTRAAQSLPGHPISGLLRAGLRVTVSTDARTVSATSVTAEFERLAADAGWGIDEFWRCQHHAAEAAFAPERTREALLQRVARSAAQPARV